MPRFGGLNMGNIGGALARNAVGTIANAVLPRSVFGGFGSSDGVSLLGQTGLVQSNADRRASLRPRPAATNRVFGSGLLNPLRETGGMIWPYTPSISYSHPIDYQPIQTVHTNQDFLVYARTPAVKLTVDGVFTVQNQKEGQYAMAAIHFLRTMAKMHFGETDPLAGTPPPVLLFNAYGAFVFKDVPVIVTTFSISFPDDVDYVEVKTVGDIQTRTIPGVPAQTGGVTGAGSITAQDLPGYVTVAGRSVPLLGPARTLRSAPTNAPTIAGTPDTVETTSSQTYTVWLPSQFKISVELTEQHTPKTLRSRFNLPAYINGANNQKDFV
jgi:hypothetical protein